MTVVSPPMGVNCCKRRATLGTCCSRSSSVMLIMPKSNVRRASFYSQCEILAMLPPVGKGAISVAFVCPSVRPSVRRVHSEKIIIRELKGLVCPNLEGRFPTFDAISMPVSRSKGQRSRSPGPIMLTHIVRHIFRTARPTNFKLGTRMEDDDPHQPQAP